MSEPFPPPPPPSPPRPITATNATSPRQPFPAGVIKSRLRAASAFTDRLTQGQSSVQEALAISEEPSVPATAIQPVRQSTVSESDPHPSHSNPHTPHNPAS